MKEDSWQGKTAVITGASSGLGRATAIELARRGAHVVVSARRLDELQRTAKLCAEAGGTATCVVADVTVEAEVAGLVDSALNDTGAIDLWVNNAGVTVFGALESAPLSDHRRVLETNLWGAILCARAIVPVFRRQRRGVLINVGSILSKVGQPFVPSYVISKFGLRGLSEALRAELSDLPNVQVCTLLPYAIDTPHFQEGANLIGRKPHAMPPVQQPEEVAQALVGLAERPRRELHVPRAAAWGLALHALFPRAVEHVIHEALAHFHFGAAEPRKLTGNLWQPRAEPASIHGDRQPRIGPAELIGWLIGHYVRRGLRVLAHV
jgi:NAD(P)-dependent dehydrogenase (short-subunit alcohol dehydrogenase family)